MVREGPYLLEMQGGLCFVLSIVMEMHIHTTWTPPISEKKPEKKYRKNKNKKHER